MRTEPILTASKALYYIPLLIHTKQIPFFSISSGYMAVKATKSLSRLSPPVSSKEPQAFSASSTPCNPQSCTRWWPDSGSRDFEANAAVILVLLFSFLVCAMSLGAAIRCFLRGEDRESPNRFPQTQQEVEKKKPNFEIVLTPTSAYSAEMKIAGAERECTICLSEFVEGEEIYVLDICNHGFHVQCIQQWLSSRFSCPICRSNILSSSPLLKQDPSSCLSSNSPVVLPTRNP